MDISFIVGCIFGSMIINYFWLRHLRTDIITHIDEIAFRLDNHIDDEKHSILLFDFIVVSYKNCDVLLACGSR